MLSRIMVGGMESIRSKSLDPLKDFLQLLSLGSTNTLTRKASYDLLAPVTMQLKWFAGTQVRGKTGGTSINLKKWLERSKLCV